MVRQEAERDHMEELAISPRQLYIDAAKSAFINLAKKEVMAILFKELAFLSWGPLGAIAGMAIQKILEIAVNQGETAIFFVYVDFRVGDQQQKFSQAAIENYRIQQTGTKEEKLEAENRLVLAFNDFVKFNSL